MTNFMKKKPKNGFCGPAEGNLRGFAARRVRAFVLAAAAMLVLAGCNTLQSIEVSKKPAQVVYGQGQRLNPAGLGVTAYYKKGNTEEVGVNGLRFSGYDAGKTGGQTVTVTMPGKWPSKPQSAEFTVNVIPVERISVLSPPTVNTIKQGADFNPAGLVVKVEFQKGAVPPENIGPERLKLSGYDKNAAGTQTITAEYYGKRTTFDLKVAAITKITIASAPDKKEYFTGEDIDLSGLKVIGTYEGFGDELLKVTLDNLSGYDKNRDGEQQVVITYQKKTASFPVKYVAMNAIKIDTQPSKLFYENGENLDISGIVVTGTRQGSTSMEMLDTDRLKVSGYDRFKAGSQTITVTIGGKSAAFKVTVGPNPFVGTWHGFETYGYGNDKKTTPVTLRMSEDTWTLTREAYVDGSTKHERLELNGTYTRDTNTGRHAVLAQKGRYSSKPDTADILSHTTLKLSCFEIHEAITLTK